MPKPAPGTRFRAYKISKRFDQDISAVLAAFRSASTAAGSPTSRSPTAAWRRRPSGQRRPRRRCSAQPWTEPPCEAAIRALARGFQPITDMRASAGYRLGWRRTCCDGCLSRPAATAETTPRRRSEPRPCLSASRAASMIRAPHDSARRHVTGEALYIDDLPEPAGRCTCQLGAQRPRRTADRSASTWPVRAAPGVVCVLTAADIPGENDVSPTHRARRADACRRTSSSSWASRSSPSPRQPATRRAVRPSSPRSSTRTAARSSTSTRRCRPAISSPIR